MTTFITEFNVSRTKDLLEKASLPALWAGPEIGLHWTPDIGLPPLRAKANTFRGKGMALKI